MEQINENDARILDEILSISLKYGFATNKELPPLDDKFLSDQPEVKKIAYSYYLDILEEFDVAEVERFKEGFHIEPIPVKTKRFMEEGGFQNYYVRLVEDKELAQIKAKQESQIRELQVKELKGNIFQLKYWWLIIVINAIIALLLTLIS